ncbi:uncharacterized protein dbf [Drosophila pseudoobscura]|uniref:Uncharacterized protein dbf n=1 Tax=Drosophila pseudoobscura pseudoobscura TaxID=46245 RepID=A0A6I8UIJ2_DROPS|nr:uncharacterized protein LOC4816504 [Drosophila pseudoobscura]
MLALQHNVNPYRRHLLVHEVLAIEGAKKIVKDAPHLPKPLTPSGHVPVLVDVRCLDTKAVYHFHVNVPPEDYEEFGRDPECQLLRLMFPMEQLPCPIHGNGLDGSGTMGVWHDPNSADKTLLLFAQTGVHQLFASQNLTIPALVSTFTEAPTANQADEIIKAHFMAALHQQQSSPLAHSVLWVNKFEEPVPAYQPPPLQIEEIQQDETGDCVTTTPGSEMPVPNEYGAGGIRKLNGMTPSRLNGYQPVQKLHSDAHAHCKVPELCLDSSGAYVQNEQLQLPGLQSKKPINGFHKQPQPSDAHPPVSSLVKLYGPNALQPLISSGIVPKNGFKPVTHTQLYSTKKDFLQPKPMFAQKNGFKSFAQMRKQQLSSPRYRGERHMMINLEQEMEIGKLWDQKSPNPAPGTAVFNDSDDSAGDQALYPNCPPEMQNLFRWNICRLCHTTMRTMRNAMDHYRSKEHDRRMGSFRMPDGRPQSSVSDDMLLDLPSIRAIDLYCELCDLKLTSNVHAYQHFHGRRHLLVAANLSRPNGTGYYNAIGRWVRTDCKWLHCELCDVSITSESQMAMHMAGARHRRHVLASYISGNMAVPFVGRHMYGASTGSMPAPKPLGLSTCTSSGPKDKANTWAPNGGYFCGTCGITMNHQKSVAQHEQGRLHQKNIIRHSTGH